MERIKIAHIITDLDVGGTEIMLLKTLRNFKRHRYEHFVISLHSRKNSLRNKIEGEGFRVYLLNLSGKNFVVPFIKLLSILKKERPYIVHNYLFHAEIVGRIAAKVMHVPVVVSSLRSLEIGGKAREALLRITDFCVDSVTAVSQKVADVHISKGTTKAEKMRVIYNGVELADNRLSDRSTVKRAIGVKDGTFVLLTVGRLEAVKGHIFLFKALEMLKERGYRFKLLVVGRGRERAKLENEIISRKLEDKVILAGEKDDILGMLAVSDVFVLPSLWEGLPNALLEAMAIGLPIVATRVGGVPEIIRDAESGLLVETKDDDALARAIERLIKEPDLRERLGRNAKEYAVKNLSIERTVAETEELYEGLLKKHGKD